MFRLDFVSVLVATCILGMSLHSVSARPSVTRTGNPNGGAVAIDPAVWPAPASGALPATSAWNPLASSFSIILPPSVNPDTVLGRATARYTAAIHALMPSSMSLDRNETATASDEVGVTITALKVEVDDASALTPFDFPVDESYNLTSEATASTVVLHAATQWGALRGFETFFQVCEGAMLGGLAPSVPAVMHVEDSPRFHWRGVMMDLARHFYSVGFIKKTMDVMVGNKMNILHLHITDDQSFPIESDVVPELVAAGAFHPTQKYSAADVADLVAYGADRGVHVVPEFDMPAHTASWGAGRPDIMVQGTGCSDEPFEHGDVMNPTTETTFDVLDELLAEQSSRFGGAFFHLGGDEVPTSCWLENATVKAWMQKQGYTTTGQIESYFVNKVASGPKFSKHDQNLVYWQEIFQNNVTLRPSTVVQAWKTDVMPDVMKAGLRVTNSYGWYLNHGCDNYGDGNWDKFYTNEPDDLAPGVTPEQRKLLLGGEVTMWSECVDEVIFEAIVWLRSSGAAEKMWSPKEATASAGLDIATRLATHRCRLLHRNVTVEPINSGGEGSHAVNPLC